MVYEVEFYKEDVISKDSKPSLTYFAEEVDSPEEAVVKAIKELGGGIKKYNSGKVKNYKFLEKGRLNPEIEKKLSDLEEKSDSLEERLNQSG